MATNATRLVDARGHGSASRGSRHETAAPPSARGQSCQPPTTGVPVPGALARRGRAERGGPSTPPGLLSPPGKLSGVGHPRGRSTSTRARGAPSARAFCPARPPRELSTGTRTTAARMRALAWLGVGARRAAAVARFDGVRWQARRAAAMDHSGARTIWVGWIWLDRWLPRSFLLQCAQDGDPFFSVHVLYCLDR